MLVQIQYINKSDRPNPHERIENVGGYNNGKWWKLSVAQAIDGIETGIWQFYVMVHYQRAKVIIATRLGIKYLKTEADGEMPNHLLSLPECP